MSLWELLPPFEIFIAFIDNRQPSPARPGPLAAIGQRNLRPTAAFIAKLPHVPKPSRIHRKAFLRLSNVCIHHSASLILLHVVETSTAAADFWQEICGSCEPHTHKI